MSVEMHQQSNDYTDDYSQNQEYDDQKQQQQQTVKEEQCNDSYVEEGDEEEGDGDNDGNEEGNDEGNDGDNGNDDDSQNQKSNNDQDYGPKCVRLRGLPWSATHKEILDFLKDVNVINGQKGIHLVTSRWDGKNTGEAYVEVQSESDVEEALKLNKGMMGHRYIEVFTATPKEAQAALKKTSGPVQSFVVKLRGLPYSVTEQQIEEFFNGLEIKADREGILFVMDKRGRATGEAYVQFESQEDTEQALGRNREKIGHRYIEIFRSSLAEMRRSTNGNGRPGPYDLKDRGSNRGDFGMGRNMRDWTSGGGGGGFGVGANNTLGFSNLSNYNNTGNFGNSFGNTGNFGNNSGSGGFSGGGAGAGFGNSRFNGPNYSGGGNFSSDFGDFGNFGNNRNNFNNGPKDFSDDSDFGVRSNSNSNFSTGGNYGSMTNFGNFGNNNNSGGNMGGGGSFSNMGGGSNFGPIGGGRNDCEYYTIHMRGLPYSCYENDVFKFFDPIRPANVRINFNKRGLHSGTSDVYFDTYEDAQLAMKRHKNQMGNRYIELFFDGKVKVGNNGNVLSNFSRRI